MTVDGAARVHAGDAPAPAVEIAHQVAGEVRRRVDLDVHDRLEQRRPRARHGVAEREPAGEPERHLARVDVVVRAVGDGRRGSPRPDSRPGSRAARVSWMPFSTAGMYCRGIEPPKMSSTNSKSAPRGSGSIVILQSPNWPWPPVCFLWRPCASTLRGDRLAVRDPRRFEVTSTPNRRRSFATVTSMCSWPWPGEQQLVRLRIARVADRRVFFAQPLHRRADLVLVAAALRLDRVGEHRLRELIGGTREAGAPCRRACRRYACLSAWRRRRGRRRGVPARASASCPAARADGRTAPASRASRLCTVASALACPR